MTSGREWKPRMKHDTAQLAASAVRRTRATRRTMMINVRSARRFRSVLMSSKF